MPRRKEFTPRKAPSSRRGTMYDRIAEARAKRERVLSERQDEGVSPEPRAATANKEPKPAATRQSPPSPKKRPVTAPESPPPENPASQPSDDALPPTAHDQEDGDDRTEPRKSAVGLWLASTVIAAAVILAVAWMSDPAAQNPFETISTIADREPGPVADRDGPQSPMMPTLGEDPDIVLAATPWTAPLRMALPRQIVVADTTLADATLATSRAPAPRPREATAAPDEFEVVAANEPVSEPDAQVQPPVFRDIRVILNAPRTVSDANLNAVIDALQDSGATPDPRRINMTISSSNVRYYHPGDAEAAAVIADGIGARLRDFTDFEPRPPEGLVEIWLAGTEVGGSASSRSTANDPLDQFARDLRQLQQDLRRALGGN